MANVKNSDAARADEIRNVLSRHVLEAMTELPDATAHETAVGLCVELAIYVTRAYPPDRWDQHGQTFGSLVIDLLSAAKQDYLDDSSRTSH